VEELKCNGKWTNCAADLLPLALSNWSRKTIKIFSSLTQKPVFDITPTLCEPDQSSSIFLAYLSSEDNSIPSHYDGCIKIGTQTNYEEAIRTDDELNQIDTDIENVNNTENGTTESDTRSPIISRKNLESQREPHNVNHIHSLHHIKRNYSEKGKPHWKNGKRISGKSCECLEKNIFLKEGKTCQKK
jgi:hypothetical protein